MREWTEQTSARPVLASSFLFKFVPRRRAAAKLPTFAAGLCRRCDSIHATILNLNYQPLDDDEEMNDRLAELRGGGGGAPISGGDIELGDVELEEGNDRSTMLKRHKDTSTVVQHGLTLASALLSVGRGLPFVGELCSAVQGCLGSAEEFGDKAEDVTIAARRVCDVLDMVQPCVGIKFHGTPGSRSISTQVHLMAKNIDRLEEDKALVESKMRRLVDLLVEFNKAVRAFGKKGWMKRAWKMRGHVHSLGRLDK